MEEKSDASSQKSRLSYSGRMILAPMVKIGTTPMRLLALDYGADIVYTEEIIDWRLLRSTRVRNPVLNTVDYIDRTDDTLVLRISDAERGKLVLQMGTSDAGRAVRVAKMVVDDIDGLDINMGCPKSFSLKGGMGAALLTQPEKIKDILTSLIEAVGSKIPVTCKIRIFSDMEKTLSLVRTIVATGVEAMAVHGRTKDERPNNDVHVDAIQRVVEEVGNRIPVIANGGSSNNRDSVANTHDGIKEFWRQTGASSVMIARAAEWNPSVFRPGEKDTVMEVIKKYLDHAIFYDYTFVMVKYTAQQILGSLQESELGKRFLASSTMRDLCAAFGREKDLDERQAWIKAQSEKLGFGLLTSSEVSMRNETIAMETAKMRTLKQMKAEKSADDEAMLKELSTEGVTVGDQTLVCEMNRRFIRGHYASDTDLPKARLLLWTRKNQEGDDEDAASTHPTYQTWTRDKSFRSLVRIAIPDDFQLPAHFCHESLAAGRQQQSGETRTVVFSSLALEKNKRYSEQAAAAVAVENLFPRKNENQENAKRAKLEEKVTISS